MLQIRVVEEAAQLVLALPRQQRHLVQQKEVPEARGVPCVKLRGQPGVDALARVRPRGVRDRVLRPLQQGPVVTPNVRGVVYQHRRLEELAQQLQRRRAAGLRRLHDLAPPARAGDGRLQRGQLRVLQIEGVAEGAVEDKVEGPVAQLAQRAVQLQRVLRGGEAGLELDAARQQRRGEEGDHIEVQTVADQQHLHDSAPRVGDDALNLVEQRQQRGHLRLVKRVLQLCGEDLAVARGDLAPPSQRGIGRVRRIVALLQLFADVQVAIADVAALEVDGEVIDETEHLLLDELGPCVRVVDEAVRELLPSGYGSHERRAQRIAPRTNRPGQGSLDSSHGGILPFTAGTPFEGYCAAGVTLGTNARATRETPKATTTPCVTSSAL